MHTEKTIEKQCPYCGALSNNHSPAFGEHISPQVGDISVCVHCLHHSILDKNGTLRVPTEEEQLEILSDEEVFTALRKAKDILRLNLN